MADQHMNSLDILIQRALSTSQSGTVPIEELFPSSIIWLDTLVPFLARVPSASLSLTSSLGGAYFLAKEEPKTTWPAIKRDANGRSIPARMAIYTAKILSSGISISALPEEFHLELLYLMCLTKELASNQLALMQDGGIWDVNSNGDASAEAEDFVTLSQKIIEGIVQDGRGWKYGHASSPTIAERLVNFTLRHSRDLTPASLYSAKIPSRVLQDLVETHGPPTRLDERFSKLGIMRAGPNTIFAATAFLVGFGEALASSEHVKTLCNRLFSDLIGAFPGLEKTLHWVVLMNACLAVYEPGQAPVDIRRQTLTLKQMTSWTDTPDEMSSGLAAEACKANGKILPSVQNVYGPYWQQIMDYCILLWTQKATQDSPEAYLHSTLKLIWDLHDANDASDDLTEAVAQGFEDASKALVGLLSIPAVLSSPGQIVNSLMF